jgi:hypothetical protein
MSRRALGMGVLLVVGGMGACKAPAGPSDPAGGPATFAAIQSQILLPSCAFSSCHAAGGAQPAARLDLAAADACRSLVDRVSCLFPAKKLVVPAAPEASFLLAKLTGAGLEAMPATECGVSSNQRMPLGSAPLPSARLEQLRAWIRGGALCHDGGPDGGGEGSGNAGGGGDGGSQAAEITSLITPKPVILSGESIQVTVTLSRSAPTDGHTLSIEVSDPTALGAPARLFVAAGQRAAAFSVLGKRPARAVSLKVFPGASTLDAAATTIQVSIAGLFLMEVLARPAAAAADGGGSNGGQWFKLRNDSPVSIDLAGYSFGAGRDSLAATRVQLAGVMAPWSCVLVGGPQAGPGNGNPLYTTPMDIDPDLPAEVDPSGQAAGFALFDSPAARVDGSSLPLDAVASGGHNSANLVGPAGEAMVPACDEPPPGHSLQRTGSQSWRSQPVPDPNTCSGLSP